MPGCALQAWRLQVWATSSQADANSGNIWKPSAHPTILHASASLKLVAASVFLHVCGRINYLDRAAALDPGIRIWCDAASLHMWMCAWRMSAPLCARLESRLPPPSGRLDRVFVPRLLGACLSPILPCFNGGGRPSSLAAIPCRIHRISSDLRS